MKIILLQDVPKVGKKWQIKTVADGFARNHLLPRGLATLATQTALKTLELQKKEDTQKAEKELVQIQKLASDLDGLEIEIPTKVSPGGEAYKGISSQVIAKILSSMGHDISKSQINLDKPIKKTGEYPVLITFKHGLEAEVKIVVIDEEEDKK